MKKLIMTISTLFIILLQVGCNINKSNLTMFNETTFDVGFNTPFTLVLYTETETEFLEHFKVMKDEVRKYNELFDIYNDYEGVNNLKTVNDNAGISPVEVDPIIIELLEESRDWAKKTDNLFDPTLGAVLTVWHEAREKGMELNREGKFGPSPTQEELEDANQYVGFKYLEIDKDKNTVYLNHERASLDVGAIAKGWAVEKVAQTLESRGVTSGIVNGGGNVRLIGPKNIKDKWHVGVTNPDALNDDAIISLAFDESMSVVTSGDYERYFVDDQGLNQHHIINPKTLQPTRFSRSVTITTKDSGLADILSTPFSMLNLEDSKKYEESLGLEDLGLIFIKTEKEDNDAGYHYQEIDGKHVYYNDQIKDHLK